MPSVKQQVEFNVYASHCDTGEARTFKIIGENMPTMYKGKWLGTINGCDIQQVNAMSGRKQDVLFNCQDGLKRGALKRIKALGYIIDSVNEVYVAKQSQSQHDNYTG